MSAPRTILALSPVVMGVVMGVVLVAGCGDNTAQHGGGSMDMSVAVTPPGPDMTLPPVTCSAVDNLGDGMACGQGCPAGQTGVLINGACKCYTKCDPNHQATCPCDRFCDPLTTGDGGAAGGACLPANGPGERCFVNGAGVPYGNGICQQGTACIRSDAAGMFRYCMYLCFGSDNICPQETQCQPVPGPMPFNVCNILHDPNPKMLGAACTIGTDVCALGSLCDGTTCKTQCDGPNATCAAGTTCTALTDPRLMKITGYVCK